MVANPAGSSAAELDRGASEPACPEPRPVAAGVAPETSRPTPTGANPLDWSGALDFLAGIPAAAVPVDAVALRAEAEGFLARVADLGPDWAGDINWGNYLWLAAGVLLTASGVQFARAAWRPRGAPDLRLPAPPLREES
jgi:hypothetical protein